jgi:hypothetical protein
MKPMKWIILGLIGLLVLAGFTVAALFFVDAEQRARLATNAETATHTDRNTDTHRHAATDADSHPRHHPGLPHRRRPRDYPRPTSRMDRRACPMRAVSGGPFYPYDRERKCPQNTLVVRARDRRRQQHHRSGGRIIPSRQLDERPR